MNGNKLTTKEWISNAYKVHGEKYGYDKSVYKYSREKIIIMCKKHGEFLQRPNCHVSQKQGCPKCKSTLIGNLRRTTIGEFLQKCKMIHGDLYDYSKVNYKNNSTKIEIVCEKHGNFWQVASSHLLGHGCSKCHFENLSDLYTSTKKEFLQQCKDIHGIIYNYSKSIYVNNRTKVEIICTKHGSFLQRPHDHLSGNGCPKCNSSKGELEIIKVLTKNNIEFVNQKRFNDCRDKIPLPFDFFIPSKNVLIEYDGEQHFKFGCNMGKYITTEKNLRDTQKKDAIKTKYAEDSGKKLIRIPYTEMKNIETILEKEIR
jgi:very-short-patch-repair endonuclease